MGSVQFDLVNRTKQKPTPSSVGHFGLNQAYNLTRVAGLIMLLPVAEAKA